MPRTAPEVAFFHQAPVQKSLERILYIWGVRCAPRRPLTISSLLRDPNSSEATMLLTYAA